MKFCPVCQTRYDEEILRFCTKDGTPLVEENPTFTAMPSQSLEAGDIGEETLIRRNHPIDIPPAQPSESDEDFSESQPQQPGQRIVISTTGQPEESVPPGIVRAKAEPQYQQPPRQKSNTALVVLATMLGTFVVLGVLGGVWYFLSNRGNDNRNINVNVNTSAPNLNTNAAYNADTSLANFDFNANTNGNVNTNVNVNANLKTPTPTRTPTPTPTRTPDDANANANSAVDLGNTNVISRPSVSPTVVPSPSPVQSPTPRTTQTPTTNTPQNVNVGIMNSRATSLPKPAYPQNARQVNAAGQVTVQITVDEEGNVTAARALSGHPLLRAPAENAARQSRFNPIRVGDQTVRATGVLVYNFINQ